MTTTEKAAAFAARLVATGEAYHASKIDHDTFHAHTSATWREIEAGGGEMVEGVRDVLRRQ